MLLYLLMVLYLLLLVCLLLPLTFFSGLKNHVPLLSRSRKQKQKTILVITNVQIKLSDLFSYKETILDEILGLVFLDNSLILSELTSVVLDRNVLRLHNLKHHNNVKQNTYMYFIDFTDKCSLIATRSTHG